MESRVEKSVYKIIDLFERFETRATFFVLGCIASEHPDLIKKIHARGHEIASHGYAHKLIYNNSPEQFRKDISRSKEVLENIVGEGVIGYRAPSYSITQQSYWALDILIEEGYRYDSSIFPIHHDRYGIPGSPRFVYNIPRKSGSILEFPISTARFLGVNLPVAGGGYLRVLPYWFTRWGIRQINAKEGKPAVVYFHPWEIDVDQPRQPVGLFTRIRHYHRIDRMKNKIEGLLKEFSFAPIQEVLGIVKSDNAHNALAGEIVKR
jgi:polysaccharide deacetylase family protein (PEP-CTERM system associated)